MAAMMVIAIAVAGGGVSILLSLLSRQFLSERIPLAGSFAGLELSFNPGVAFGISFSPLLQVSLIMIALLVVAWMAFWSVRLPRTHCEPMVRSYALAYGLILGGGIANIVDRIPDGLVTDYFQIGTFPIFNMADSCITIGAGLLLWETLWKSGKRKVERGR